MIIRMTQIELDSLQNEGITRVLITHRNYGTLRHQVVRDVDFGVEDHTDTVGMGVWQVGQHLQQGCASVLSTAIALHSY